MAVCPVLGKSGWLEEMEEKEEGGREEEDIYPEQRADGVKKSHLQEK